MPFLIRLVVAAIVACNFNEVKPPPPPPPPCAAVPQPPQSVATSSTTTVTYAFDSIFLGDTHRETSTFSTTAWKDYGFDLDGLFSDQTSTDVCSRASGAPSSVQADGSCGRDNSFGAKVLLILQSAGSIPNPSQTQTATMRDGNVTLEVQVSGLDLGVTSQTNVGLSVQTFAAGKFDPSKTPSFVPSEDWPVRSDLYSDPKKGDRFDVAFITKGTLVARGGTMTLPMVFQGGVPFDLTIHGAILTMTVNGDQATSLASSMRTSSWTRFKPSREESANRSAGARSTESRNRSDRHRTS